MFPSKHLTLLISRSKFGGLLLNHLPFLLEKSCSVICGEFNKNEAAVCSPTEFFSLADMIQVFIEGLYHLNYDSHGQISYGSLCELRQEKEPQ